MTLKAERANRFLAWWGLTVLLISACGTSAEELTPPTTDSTLSSEQATASPAATPTTAPTTITTTPRTTTTAMPRTTTTTLTGVLARRAFWLALGEVLQIGDESVISYWNRAADAGYNSRYAEMGAECALASNLLNGWYRAVPPAPDASIQNLVDSYFNELDDFFYWCSGGTASSVDLAAPHFRVGIELLERLDSEAETDGIEDGLIPG